MINYLLGWKESASNWYGSLKRHRPAKSACELSEYPCFGPPLDFVTEVSVLFRDLMCKGGRFQSVRIEGRTYSANLRRQMLDDQEPFQGTAIMTADSTAQNNKNAHYFEMKWRRNLTDHQMIKLKSLARRLTHGLNIGQVCVLYGSLVGAVICLPLTIVCRKLVLYSA